MFTNCATCWSVSRRFLYSKNYALFRSYDGAITWAFGGSLCLVKNAQAFLKYKLGLSCIYWTSGAACLHLANRIPIASFLVVKKGVLPLARALGNTPEVLSTDEPFWRLRRKSPQRTTSAGLRGLTRRVKVHKLFVHPRSREARSVWFAVVVMITTHRTVDQTGALYASTESRLCVWFSWQCQCFLKGKIENGKWR